MDAVAEAAVAPFRLVEPLFGFGAEPVPPPLFGIDGTVATTLIGRDTAVEEPEPCLTAAPRCAIRRQADKPFLQCELAFPSAEGWLEVYEDGRLVDRAELVPGWQHSAVSLAAASPDARLELVFRNAAGEDVEGVHVRALFLSDEWGRGQRRRLKCDLPFRLAAVFADFSVSPCCARQWMNGDPTAGNTREQDIAEIWNGPFYQRMRAQFLAKDYGSTCREDICPVLAAAGARAEPPLPVIRAINEGLTELDFGPSSFHHDIDQGCNLECVMCRDEKILPNRANVDQAIGDIEQALDLGALEHISFSGAGEIFVMAKVVRLLESDKFSSRGVKLGINTNLTHFNERLWQRIRHNQFRVVVVSADGCSPEVYDSIRVGARWAVVERNMRFLAELRRAGAIEQIVWNYTVQRENVVDVGKAIRHARALGFDNIRLIAQLGSRARTGGNMFEELDLDVLDRLYDVLEAEGAFDDPMVVTAELGIGARRYRAFAHRFELARHIFERHGYGHGSGIVEVPSIDWHRCVGLIDGIVADIEAGHLSAPAGVSAAEANFLRGLVVRARPSLAPRRIREWLRYGPAAERRVSRWAKRMLRDNERERRRLQTHA